MSKYNDDEIEVYRKSLLHDYGIDNDETFELAAVDAIIGTPKYISVVTAAIVVHNTFEREILEHPAVLTDKKLFRQAFIIYTKNMDFILSLEKNLNKRKANHKRKVVTFKDLKEAAKNVVSFEEFKKRTRIKNTII